MLEFCHLVEKNGSLQQVCTKKLTGWSIASIVFACLAVVCFILYIACSILERTRKPDADVEQQQTQQPFPPPVMYGSQMKPQMQDTPQFLQEGPMMMNGFYGNQEMRKTAYYANSNITQQHQVSTKELDLTSVSSGSTVAEHHLKRSPSSDSDFTRVSYPPKTLDKPLHKI